MTVPHLLHSDALHDGRDGYIPNWMSVGCTTQRLACQGTHGDGAHLIVSRYIDGRSIVLERKLFRRLCSGGGIYQVIVGLDGVGAAGRNRLMNG